MCETCGCGGGETTLIDLQTGARTLLEQQPIPPQETATEHVHGHFHPDGSYHEHDHSHDHEHEHHEHDHVHRAAPTTVVELNARILAKNDTAAGRNRAWFSGREILALNLMSGPGAGKTTLLERTIADLKERQKLFVLEGDQATDNDGERVKAAGAAAVQINTGSGCHLDAEMVARGLAMLKPEFGSLLLIENVGNLVCPALFDLGEHKRVAILSVTEGDDKPLKYPHMFRAADLLLLNKIDLLPYVDFDMARATANARRTNPAIEVIPVSARTGEGMGEWEQWIARAQADARAGAFI